jgi:hypothetical protein
MLPSTLSRYFQCSSPHKFSGCNACTYMYDYVTALSTFLWLNSSSFRFCMLPHWIYQLLYAHVISMSPSLRYREQFCPFLWGYVISRSAPIAEHYHKRNSSWVFLLKCFVLQYLAVNWTRGTGLNQKQKQYIYIYIDHTLLLRSMSQSFCKRYSSIN